MPSGWTLASMKSSTLQLVTVSIWPPRSQKVFISATMRSTPTSPSKSFELTAMSRGQPQ